MRDVDYVSRYVAYMERGWDATGRLAAVWHRVGGRDALAELTGITPTTLRAYNSGSRPLGAKNAAKIASVKKLRTTIFELGAPAAAASREDDRSLVDHLAKLVETVGRLQEAVDAMERRLSALEHPRVRRGARSA